VALADPPLPPGPRRLARLSTEAGEAVGARAWRRQGARQLVRQQASTGTAQAVGAHGSEEVRRHWAATSDERGEHQRLCGEKSIELAAVGAGDSPNSSLQARLRGQSSIRWWTLSTSNCYSPTISTATWSAGAAGCLPHCVGPSLLHAPPRLARRSYTLPNSSHASPNGHWSHTLPYHTDRRSRSSPHMRGCRNPRLPRARRAAGAGGLAAARWVDEAVR
jgi:hypothetical protein